MSQITNLMMQLIGSVLNGKPIKEGITISKEDSQKLFMLAKKHDVAHIIPYAAKKNAITFECSETAKLFNKQMLLAIVRYERMQHEFKEICRILEASNISFIPLKGAVIRDCYPEKWLRTSCDIDILVHGSDLETAKKQFTKELGYKLLSVGNHDIGFETQSGIHFELHYNLADNVNEDKLLKNIWKYASPCNENSTCYVLADKMLYYYHIVHMAKHFINGGCGIKPFIDIFLMKKAWDCSAKKSEDMLLKRELYEFASQAEKLSEVWFSGVPHSSVTAVMENYIIDGGVYGTSDNKQAMNKTKRKNGFSYKLSRIFLPMALMKLRYPVLDKCVWLLPLCHLHRFVSLIFSLGKKKSREKNSVLNSNDMLVVELVNKLGLNKF